MRKPVTVREIGAAAGVSPATVSYVLSGNGAQRAIPARTQQHVRRVASRLGWQPNHMRSAFFTGKTKLIGMWQQRFGESYHNEVTRTMEAVLRADGYAMLVSPALKDNSSEEFDLHLFNRWSVDGLLALGGSVHLMKFLGAHPEWLLPVVNMVSFPLADAPRVDTVYVDVLTPARAGLERWVAEGRRGIAMLSGHDAGSTEQDPREQLYRAFVRERGITEELIIFPKRGDQRHSAEDGLRAHLAIHGCPEAIFCRSDETLMGAYRALRLLGIEIPKQVALLGIDGIQDTRYLDQPVATVAQPVAQMCRAAWALLRDRLENPERPARRENLAGRLVWLGDDLVTEANDNDTKHTDTA
ncbi:MAG: LacI family transcriptional regulator [Candidatus Marinimicrobia bacterium]|nr:LacI family transcriptional regulator [Candidatus Neomarinimicrobiota bacterium]